MAGLGLPEWARRDSNARPLAPDHTSTAACIANRGSCLPFLSHVAASSDGKRQPSRTISAHHFVPGFIVRQFEMRLREMVQARGAGSGSFTLQITATPAETTVGLDSRCEGMLSAAPP